MKRKAKKQGTVVVSDIKEVVDATAEELALIPSPGSNVAGDLTPPRDFNLMFSTQVGALEGSSSSAFLRPETAQGQGALRHRADRQGLPQRNHAAQLHLPLPGVR